MFAVLTTLGVAGCQTFAPVTDDAQAAIRAQVKRASCAPWRPISTSRRDVLTDETASQISRHNNVWDEICASP